MTDERVIRSIHERLPQLLRSDPSLRDYILTVAYDHFPAKVEVEDRFTRMLNELARDREAQSRKWEEQKREDRRKWEEQSGKWEEQKQEDRRQWEESNRRFDEMNKRIDRSIGALGARWGMQSERAFRDALAGILEESFGVQVINVNEFDDEGEVFGQPDQIELDIIIKNGLLIICELKSSMSKSDMHIFERKVRFYEKHHRRQANRIIVVSPMLDDRARRVGNKFGIEMYPDSLDVSA